MARSRSLAPCRGQTPRECHRCSAAPSPATSHCDHVLLLMMTTTMMMMLLQIPFAQQPPHC
jgi:hypothetical protein